jgi:hypothetical protein
VTPRRIPATVADSRAVDVNKGSWTMLFVLSRRLRSSFKLPRRA